jgi:hypothetical protein
MLVLAISYLFFYKRIGDNPTHFLNFTHSSLLPTSRDFLSYFVLIGFILIVGHVTLFAGHYGSCQIPQVWVQKIDL